MRYSRVRDILANPAFLRAMLTNFFFFSSQNGFVLLPLYVKQLGGTELEIGLVMGIYSAVGIVAQPLLGPWVDALGRRPFMLVEIACVLASTLLAAVAHRVPLLVVVRVLQASASARAARGRVAHLALGIQRAVRGQRDGRAGGGVVRLAAP